MLGSEARFPLVVALSLVLLVSSCATLVVPSMQQIPVDSMPVGADVYVDGALVGMTPLVVELEADKRHEVVVRLGDEARAWVLEPQVGLAGAGGIVGDILILVPTGLLGAGMISFGTDSCLFDVGCTPEPNIGLLLAGVGVTALALTPLVVDLTTNQFYELIPIEIDAHFE